MSTVPEDVPTCGKGLAENATVPAKMADLIASLADNLEAHLPTIDDADANGVTERDAYLQLVESHREIATQLHAVAALMAAHRDLPMARHFPQAFHDPRILEAFAGYVEIEEDLLEVLGNSATRDRAMLAEIRAEQGRVG